MTDTSIYEPDPASDQERQDAAKARGFKADPYLDELLAKVKADPTHPVPVAVRASLGVYADFREASTRHNQRETR
ncbi:MAG: hypothetical protein ACR2FP_07720 [Nocardioidaceae bacterium]